MKHLITFLVVILSLSTITFSQDEMPYTAVSFTEDYIPLDDWYPLNVGEMWDVPIVTLNLQFEFPCFGDTATLVRLTDLNGGIELYTPGGEFHLISGTTMDINDVLNVADPLSTDGSTHRYITVGESPNRIFKLEFNNIGFDYEMLMTGGAASTANFQIWLYENGMIEIHYGPNTVNNIDDITFWSSMSAGLSSYWNFEYFTSFFLWANGSPGVLDFPYYENVEFDSLQISPDFTGWTSWPEDGLVYRFNYDYSPIIAVNELTAKSYIVYPNPSTEKVTISTSLVGKELNIIIYNPLGKEIYRQLIHQETTIDTSNWKAGVYTIVIDGGSTTKLIVN
tara:strand:+ start:1903 stop:2913 length:1011 start_codon:yes stop_codon:yes gene_type:complete